MISAATGRSIEIDTSQILVAALTSRSVPGYGASMNGDGGRRESSGRGWNMPAFSWYLVLHYKSLVANRKLQTVGVFVDFQHC
jgi:hypothetical protein